MKKSLRSRGPNNSMVIKTGVINKGIDQTLGFSILDNAVPFGYEFMQHFGAPMAYGSARTRVHIIVNHMEDNNIKPIGFSYPLCGYENSD